MAKTVEQINAEIAKLQEERRELLKEHVKVLKMKAVDVLQELLDLDELPARIKDAVTAKDGTTNIKRVFAIRG